VATYQEQLEKTRSSQTHKLMVALAELADIDKGLSILVREKIVDSDGRFALLELFIRQHPEIRRHFKTDAAKEKT
jgi:hypothetical protein